MSVFVGRADELHDLEAFIALPEDAPAAAVIVRRSGSSRVHPGPQRTRTADLRGFRCKPALS
jgi:hypothetical protein